jgi:hypothetical protein
VDGVAGAHRPGLERPGRRTMLQGGVAGDDAYPRDQPRRAVAPSGRYDAEPSVMLARSTAPRAHRDRYVRRGRDAAATVREWQAITTTSSESGMLREWWLRQSWVRDRGCCRQSAKSPHRVRLSPSQPSGANLANMASLQVRALPTAPLPMPRTTGQSPAYRPTHPPSARRPAGSSAGRRAAGTRSAGSQRTSGASHHQPGVAAPAKTTAG